MRDLNLTIATYNIHRGIGVDGRTNLQRIVDVLLEINADIVGIQEIDSHCIFEEGHQLNFIAKKTGYHVAAGPTMWKADTQYGNALLSRFPIKVLRQLDLTMGSVEPRGALDVDLDMDGLHGRVITTHLGLRWFERKYQLAKLFEGVRVSDAHPLIIMGDMNEWLPFMGATRIFREHFGFSAGLRSYPSFLPLLGLDQIYVCPGNYLVETEVHRTSLSKRASDHLPVKAHVFISRQAAQTDTIEVDVMGLKGERRPSGPLPQ